MADYRHCLTWGIRELFASGKQILIIDPTSDGEEMQAILRSLGLYIDRTSQKINPNLPLDSF